jgi:hypothetical protein
MTETVIARCTLCYELIYSDEDYVDNGYGGKEHRDCYDGKRFNRCSQCEAEITEDDLQNIDDTSYPMLKHIAC